MARDAGSARDHSEAAVQPIWSGHLDRVKVGGPASGGGSILPIGIFQNVEGPSPD
jgi:hypothetical protein